MVHKLSLHFYHTLSTGKLQTIFQVKADATTALIYNSTFGLSFQLHIFYFIGKTERLLE
jgi:hypothetical protein